MINKEEDPDFKIKPPTVNWVSYGPSLSPVLAPILILILTLIGVLVAIEHLCFG